MSGFWFSLLLTTVTQVSPSTLTGAVHDEIGQPVPGASVFISTAAPRKGVGVL